MYAVFQVKNPSPPLYAYKIFERFLTLKAVFYVSITFYEWCRKSAELELSAEYQRW